MTPIAMRFSRRATELAVAMGLAMTSAHAQQTADSTRGVLRTPPLFNFVLVPPAQKASATATLQKLMDIVLRDPGFNAPIGYDMQPSARAGVPRREGYSPVEYDITGLLYWYRADPNGGVRVMPVSMVAVYVSGNGISRLFTQTSKWKEDEQGEIYFEPPRVPDIQGFPVYGKGLVVVTRNSKPIVVPVSRERAIRAILAVNKRDLESTRKSGAQQRMIDMMAACASRLEEELARLSPAERGAPAAINLVPARGRSGLCEPPTSADDPKAVRLIAENRDFFDRTLPPSAIQAVLVNLSQLSVNSGAERGELKRIRDGLDFAALADLTARAVTVGGK